MASYTKTNWVNGTTPINATNLNKIENALEQVFGMIYPVGSIYMSVRNTNPNTYFGGTWVAWGSGRVPVGVNTSDSSFNTVEKTGGEKTHTLTVNEMPSHSHSGTARYYRATSVTREDEVNSQTGTQGLTGDTGGGQAHNNLQPYITCYMWKRTA